ncbi:hypothetical protein Q3O60_10825 [Alkalimonas collagenimarina]|uniref:Uncharacterized protein n=1 Tax=Alkalimonas collagenimarina TaxID=400390 RepID=A0ABT9H042_9GAMM|nr:hypothetical protein [Alkalimonas collagenimarina]MDP4536684.1 hypothetical protein [Alkalimonas collagenimarina]
MNIFLRSFITNKDLVKDTFQAFAYFVFIAGIVKLSLPYVSIQPLYYKILYVTLFFIMTSLAMFFAIFHVCVPITKIKFPSFDAFSNQQQNISFKTFITKKESWFWMLSGFPFYLIGIEIIKLGFYS